MNIETAIETIAQQRQNVKIADYLIKTLNNLDYTIHFPTRSLHTSFVIKHIGKLQVAVVIRNLDIEIYVSNVNASSLITNHKYVTKELLEANKIIKTVLEENFPFNFLGDN